MSSLAVLQNNYEVRSPSDSEISSYSSTPTVQQSVFDFISILPLTHFSSEDFFSLKNHWLVRILKDIVGLS